MAAELQLRLSRDIANQPSARADGGRGIAKRRLVLRVELRPLWHLILEFDRRLAQLHVALLPGPLPDKLHVRAAAERAREGRLALQRRDPAARRAGWPMGG